MKLYFKRETHSYLSLFKGKISHTIRKDGTYYANLRISLVSYFMAHRFSGISQNAKF